MVWDFDYNNNSITVDTDVMISEPFVNDGNSYTAVVVEVKNPNQDFLDFVELYVVADDSSETLISWDGGTYNINSSSSPKYKLVNTGSPFVTRMFDEKGLAMLFSFNYL
jgi:hypothetical protein